MKAFYYSLLVLAFLGSCNSGANDMMVVTNRGPAQGTFYNITYLAPAGIDYRRSIDSILFVIDQSMSLWQQNSTISQLNRGDTLKVSTGFVHFMNVYRTAQSVSLQTDGAFDISIAPLVNYWGFGPEARSVIDSAKTDSLVQLVGFEKLKTISDSGYLKPGMQVDMNAIAQGYTVDVIALFLNGKGIRNYLIEVGGEMKARGKNARGDVWTIGINKPSEDSKVAEQLQVIISLDSAALATSGNYRKFWEDKETGIKYVHTIDPKTGYPVKTRLLSASIIADNCAAADAWATACMVMGLEKAKERVTSNDDLEAYFVYSDLDGNWQVWQTPGFEKMIK
jgi:thiamine biosynthesis lipoprotein